MNRLEKKVTLLFAIILAALTSVFSVGVVFGIDLHSIVADAYYKNATEKWDSIFAYVKRSETPTDSEGIEYDLRLEFPVEINSGSVDIQSEIKEKRVFVSAPWIKGDYYKDYPLIGGSMLANALYYDNPAGGKILLEFDKIVSPVINIEGNYLYIDFLTAKEIYDYVVVVDAGHGGNDNGTAGGDVLEKDLNLSIANRVYEILSSSEKNIGVFMTRTEDENVSLDDRAALSNDLEADVFLSIHNNSTASGRTSDINGTEVLYMYSDKTGRSHDFANRILNSLINALGSNNRGLLAGDEMAVIRKTRAPAVIAEIGFMSNPVELAKLCDESYQELAANAMAQTILEWLNEENTYSDGE